jgi:hypothetical protein
MSKVEEAEAVEEEATTTPPLPSPTSGTSRRRVRKPQPRPPGRLNRMAPQQQHSTATPQFTASKVAGPPACSVALCTYTLVVVTIDTDSRSTNEEGAHT